MKLPNALIVSILAAVQMIVNQNFHDLWWTPAALAIIVSIGKLIQVNVTEPPAATTRGLSPEGTMSSAQPEPSKLRRWLID